MAEDIDLGAVREAFSERYQVEREIGRGGMATVYLARQIDPERQVAIKILRREGAADGPDRFLREIRVTAGLSHPHILPLLESGEIDGLPFYIMPFVEGESLRERLRRDPQLPLAEAVGIALEVADALTEAHRHGIVHRDIKPANILLEAGHAVVADFGIVRPAGLVGETLTEPGRSVGTPCYESPEQWAGEGWIDGRADVYSLGCVLYEMLTGEPPFTGSSPQAIAAKHALADVPSVTTLRRNVPAAIDAVVHTALEKAPADRFETAADFASALKKAYEGRLPRDGPKPGKAWWSRVAAVAVLAAAALLLRDRLPGIGSPAPGDLDTLRYVILPFGSDSTPEPDLDVVQRLGGALERWEGVTVADPVDVRALGADEQAGPLSDEMAARLASELDAGRVVRGSVTTVGGDLVVNAQVRDAAAQGAWLGSQRILVPADRSGLDSLFAELADGLLFREAPRRGDRASFGTRRLTAAHDFLRGQSALSTWDLVAADSAFSAAVDADPGYAEAHLWIALSRAWRGLPGAQWRIPAQQAVLGVSLSQRNRLLAEAILAQAHGDLPRACARWQELTGREPGYFAGWYGSAECRVKDSAVLEDPRSPSGWSFRTSYHQALQEYRRAFELFPPMLASYRRGSYEALRRLFMTAATARRQGSGRGGERIGFAAVPAWRGDSLALVPYPVEDPEVELTVAPAELEAAVDRMRTLFYEVALSWVTMAPESPGAQEALAVSLAMLGDPNAMAVIRRARELAQAEEERLGIAGVEIWMQLTFSLPFDLDGIRAARALADSLLAESRVGGPGDPLMLAGLATLTGRGAAAASFMRVPGVAERIGGARALRDTGPALLVHAALGGPADTLDLLEERVSAIVEETLNPADRPMARLIWLARAATLAFPQHVMASVETLEGRGDYLLDLQAAYLRGDTAAVRRGLGDVRTARARLLPSGLTLDGLYPEADLLVRLGDHEGASDWLDPTLRSLPSMSSRFITDPVLAAALVRAAALRATIAHHLGDRDEAVRWRQAVMTLWSDADPSLQPHIEELRRLFR